MSQSLKKNWQSFIQDYARQAGLAVASLAEQQELVQKIAHALINSVKNGGRIYSCGNGGSACDSMHLTEELVARYLRERPGIPAQHLQDAATITCWSNDYDYSGVFERQVATLVTKKDVLIIFSTSGNSSNVVKAAKKAKEIGAYIVAFSGKNGGELKSLCDLSLIIQSEITSHIQEAHITAVHMICDIMEQELYF